MRRSLRLVAVAIITACASASPPPGGPEDKAPPLLVRAVPDTNSVNQHPSAASFFFDETINDRGTGDQDIERYFLLSPSEGNAHVSWHRSRIDIKPRDGFKNGVAYSITLLPGLTDLRGNRMKVGRTIVFSTGASIPPYRINGTAFDWVAERVAPNTFIEVFIPGPDSVKYLAIADSVGHFDVGPLAQGTYVIRAIADQNNNRGLDRNEAFDTLRVSVPMGTPAELLLTLRDTLPARILTVALNDSLTIAVTFDRSLDPAGPLDASMFRVIGPDSTPVTIAAAITSRQQRIADSLARKVVADSARRADSLAGKPLPAPPAPPALAPGQKEPPPPPPKPSRPPPISIVNLKLTKPLAPNVTYRVTATGVRALSGQVATSERTFTTPKPAPPPKVKDSTVVRPVTPKDSAAAKPVTPPTSRPPRS